MNWLLEAFSEPTVIQAIVVISLVSATGLFLGKLKLFGVSLGITFVFLQESLPDISGLSSTGR